MSISLHRHHTRLAGLVVLEALAGSVLDGSLAGNDLLDGGEDAAPVLEDGERNALAGAVGDEVWWTLVEGVRSGDGRSRLTVALLGEKEVGFAGSGKVGNTVAGVEEGGALVGGELSVGAESEGFVVAEAAGGMLALNWHVVSTICSADWRAKTYLSSWYWICQPPSWSMVLSPRGTASLQTMSILSASGPTSFCRMPRMTGVMPEETTTVGMLFASAHWKYSLKWGSRVMFSTR